MHAHAVNTLGDMINDEDLGRFVVCIKSHAVSKLKGNCVPYCHSRKNGSFINISVRESDVQESQTWIAPQLL